MRMLNSITLWSVMIGATALLVSATSSADETEVDLNVGNAAPVFDGIDDQGKVWKSSDHVGKKILVIYFYPADFTTGCTRQAESWRDNMNELVDRGAEVIGISGDSVENHRLFKDVWKLNFTLLADEEGTIAKQFGVPIRRGGKTRARGPDRQYLRDEAGERIVLERKATFVRSTFIVGSDGKIVYKHTKVRPTQDSLQVLEFIAGLKRELATK